MFGRFFRVVVGGALVATQCGSAGAAPVPDGVTTPGSNQLWRMSGRLVARDGRAFSYAAEFFRYVEPHGVVLFPASLSVMDESSRRFFSERRTERADFGLAAAAMGSLDVRVGTWRLRESESGDGSADFELDAKLASVDLHVRGTARKPRFTLRSETAQQDEYSSIASEGTIAIDGSGVAVAGKSWLDHERFGARSAGGPVEQVHAQLDDGREIYVESTGSGSKFPSQHRAYLIERDGTVDTLGPAAYEFGENGALLSPRTRTRYADGWNLHVDDKTEFLLLEPVTYDQESVARHDGASYWDGAVDIFDVTPGSQGLRLGSGDVLMYRFPAKRASS